jgi:O-antigen ligase
VNESAARASARAPHGSDGAAEGPPPPGAPSAAVRSQPKGFFTAYKNEIGLLVVLAIAMFIAMYAKSARPALAFVLGLVFVKVAFTRLDFAVCLVMLYLVAPPVMMIILLTATQQRVHARMRGKPKDDPTPARLRRGNPMLAPTIVFFVITFISACISPLTSGYELTSTLTDVKSFLMFVLLTTVVASGLDKDHERRTVFVGFLLSLAFLTGFGLRDTVTNLGNPRFRLDTFIGQANEFGGFMAMYTPLVVTALLAPKLKTRARLALIALLFMCCVSIIYTMSRGSMLGVVAGLLVIGAIYSRKFLALVILAAALHTWWLPDRVINRFEETTEEEGMMQEYGVDKSTAVRVQQWKGIPNMIWDRPVFGHGFDAFPNIYRVRVSGKFKAAHSSWIRILVEEGIVGLTVVLWLMASIALMAWRVMRRGEGFFAKTLGPGMLAAVAVCIVVNVSGARFHNPIINAYFWVLCGLLIASYRTLPVRAAPARASRPNLQAGFFSPRRENIPVRKPFPGEGPGSAGKEA